VTRRPCLVVAALLFAVGCSRSPSAPPAPADAGEKPSVPPAASIPPAPPSLEKAEVVALMETLARVHADHQKDCGRLTTELEAFEATRAGELVRAAPSAYAAIEADPPLAARLGHAMETIMTVSMACAKDPRFIALHARRRGLPASSAPPSTPPAPASASP
jgi:hypothetical protein